MSIHGSQRRVGFTLIELLVVIAIIAILAAILFPVFARAREKARGVSCLNNVKQMGLAMMMYTQDYDEYFTMDAWNVTGRDPTVWCSRYNPMNRPEFKIAPYIKNTQVFACPSSNISKVNRDTGRNVCTWNAWGFPDVMCLPIPQPMSFGWNAWVFFGSDGSGAGSNCSPRPTSVSAVQTPAGKIMMGDSTHNHLFVDRAVFANFTGSSSPNGNASNARSFWTDGTNGTRGDINPDNHTRHTGGQNYAFLDGHAKWMQHSSLGGHLGQAADKWMVHFRP